MASCNDFHVVSNDHLIQEIIYKYLSGLTILIYLLVSVFYFFLLSCLPVFCLGSGGDATQTDHRCIGVGRLPDGENEIGHASLLWEFRRLENAAESRNSVQSSIQVDVHFCDHIVNFVDYFKHCTIL